MCPIGLCAEGTEETFLRSEFLGKGHLAIHYRGYGNQFDQSSERNILEMACKFRSPIAIKQGSTTTHGPDEMGLHGDALAKAS